MTSTHLTGTSIDPAEVAYFERLAHRWWDTAGPFWPLHRLNALRIDYLRDRAARALGRDPGAARPFADLAVLDIGCGGGILSADDHGAAPADSNSRAGHAGSGHGRLGAGSEGGHCCREGGEESTRARLGKYRVLTIDASFR